MDSSQLDCIYTQDQTISIADGGTLQVHQTELTKKDLVDFTLLVEASGEAKVINQLFNDPAFLRGVEVRCIYEGTEVIARLEILTNHEFTLPSKRSILHFACSTIKSDAAIGEIFEFLLPFVDFGQGDQFTSVKFPNGGMAQTADRLSFNIEGHIWTLRHLIEIDHVFYTADEAIALQKKDATSTSINLSHSSHSMLQVTASIGQEEAESVATKICWLLHLALGQSVAWAEMRTKRGEHSSFLCQRPFAFPKKVSPSPPLRNWLDGRIKSFLETAYPLYQGSEKWWSETLNWYSIAAENNALESSSMILCMLFDRISSRLLEDYQFPKQIGEDLASYLALEENKKGLYDQFSIPLKPISSSWTDLRSTNLVGVIDGWNNWPSYPNKIAAAYELAGLKAPDKKLIGHRHRLMHDGGLKLEGHEAVIFLGDLYEQILGLLFSMLGYKGVFVCKFKGERDMRDLALPSTDS